MNAEQNERLTRITPGTPCGQLMRQYWQPAALVDEFNPAIDPRLKNRPVKAVTLLGQEMVLFKDASGDWGLLDRDCAHRGADLSFGRLGSLAEGGGLRCPFHGWKFAADGRCLETPAEPAGSKLCQHVKQRSYPVIEKSGALFAWLGDEGTAPPPLPAFDCFTAPASHSFAFKGLWNANWLQAFEVGIDPAHRSFLPRFLPDAPLGDIGQKASVRHVHGAGAHAIAGEPWPMARIMREFAQPDISFESTPWGMQLTALRPMTEQLTHVRVTNAIFPATFVMPLSETMTLTQMHVPVDDTHTYWYSFFTSFADPLDRESMRAQRQQFISLPDYIPKAGRHNAWGFIAQEQLMTPSLGLAEDAINVHDQWAVESMGAIQDRTREHLATSDKAIAANRRVLLNAIATVQAGGIAPGVADAAVAAQRTGPDTLDGIAPAANWAEWWQQAAQAKRDAAPWDAALATPSLSAADLLEAPVRYSPHEEAS
ncbi:MAG: ring-hydroxylating oxygenase subunit alpha [Burkholderiales bacterium RIFCSPHIGHO2_12_FULL_61_11]|nr:MAG: ring-hydroxylating oxygenase subunit alpha [Burkholderiales bacterium RIFCSPHIGHO2_12_FULL_61_11]